MSNVTTVCLKQDAPNPPPLIQNGDFHFQTHQVGFILCGIFAIISTVVSGWLINKHLQWYTNKREQRYIVRILFMVPIYALISFASFYFWNQSTPIVLVRDSYEAIVLTAFFYLLLMYLSDDPEEQKRIFLRKGLSREADRIATQRGLPVEKWCFPLWFIKWKPSDGLYFLQLMKWGVLQYCVIRPTTTLAAVVLDSVGLYCESSWNPRWGHAYIIVIISISVSIAMYCLVQLFIVVAAELAPHKPLLKLFSIKAVVFLTFWQATFLSILTMVGLIKDTEYMTAEDITIGIGAVIETFEMMLFAFLHIRAFTYKPYKEIAIKTAKGRRPTPTPRWRSLGHAVDFRETFREIWIGCVYMFDKMRGKEPKPDFGARRNAHYEIAFGRSRIQGQNSLPGRSSKHGDKETTAALEVERDVSVELEGHKQFLGLSKYDRYSVHPDREKSDGLEEQINHELQRLGYPKLSIDLDPLPEPRPPHRLPWWRTLYDRISQSGQDADLAAERESFFPPRQSNRFSRQNQSHPQRNDVDVNNININIDDDVPPVSLLLPPPRASPLRNAANFQDHAPGAGSGSGRGYWQEQDPHLPGSVQRLNPSRDAMIDPFDPRANFFDGDDNGTRTTYTERAGFDPIYSNHHLHPHPHHDPKLSRNVNFGNPQPFSSHSPPHLWSRNLPQRQPHHVQTHVRANDQVQAQVQPQPQASRPSYPILPPAPRGALVSPPQAAPLGHSPRPGRETSEFDPWKEHGLSHVYPSLEVNHHPDPDPPPPPLPPKDVPIPPNYHGSHRREPAVPYSPPSDPTATSLLSGLPLPSGLPPASDQDTNRHSDIYEPCNDSS